MSRTKVTKGNGIKNLEEVNGALYDLAQAQLELQKIDNAAAEEITRIQKDADRDGKAYREQIKELESKILTFAESKKKELFPEDKKNKNAKRSVKLSFGSFGFRKSTSINILNELKTINLIEKTKKALAAKIGILEAVERTPKINKNSLRSFDDATLAKFGIKREKDDAFFIDTDLDAVNLQLQKAKSA